MKFALVNGQRQEAQPGLSGKCPNPNCGHPVVAKCGRVKIRHWAHQAGRLCDRWWENETRWHRAWKNRFPIDWQEVVHHSQAGEKHIADVKTDRDWVIEFQHSRLEPEERRSRETFYGKLIWVVHGTRRERDVGRFFKAWGEGSPVGNSAFVRRLRSDECALMREWADSNAPIFFDFGDEQPLWWVTYGRPSGSAYVLQFPGADFIEMHRSAGTQAVPFDDFLKKLNELVAGQEALRQAQAVNRPFPQPPYGGSPVRNRRRRRL
jgi:hypothetical protein